MGPILVEPERNIPTLSKKYNLTCAIVYQLEAKIDELDYVFLALDLNNIPYVEIMDRESVSLFIEQNKVQNQLQQVLEEQAQVRAQLASITEQLIAIRTAKVPVSSHTTVSDQRKVQLEGQEKPVSSAPIAEASAKTFADKVKERVPRGHTMDAEGFVSKDPRPQHASGPSQRQRRAERPMVTGVRAQGKLKPTVNIIRLFATRFSPDETENDLKAYVNDLIGSECNVDKIVARTTRHSSFIITASRRYEKILLNPNSWEEGVQVRYFYGRLNKSNVVNATENANK